MVCLNCGKNIFEGCCYCPFCGAKQIVCVDNENIDDSEFVFCNNCGYKLKHKNNTLKGQKKCKYLIRKLPPWLKPAFNSLIILLILMFSFLPIGKVKVMDALPSLGQNINNNRNIEIRYNVINITSTTCDYVFRSYTLQKYEAEVYKEIIELKETVSFGPYVELTSKQIRKANRVLTKIAFYSFTIPETREATKISIAYLVFLNIVIATVFIINLIFLILSIIKIAKGKYYDKTLKLSLWVLSLALILFFASDFHNKASMFSMGPGPILILVASIVLFLTNLIYEFIIGNYKVNIMLLAKKITGLALASLILILINGPGMKYKYQYKHKPLQIFPEITTSVTDKERIHELLPYYDILFSSIRIDRDKAYYREIVYLLEYPSIETLSQKTKYIIDSSLSFATRNFEKSTSTHVFLIIAGVFHIVVNILLLLVILNMLKDLISEKEKSKNSNNILLLISLGIWITILIFLDIACHHLNKNLIDLELQHYAFVGFVFYFACLVFAGLIISENLFPAKKHLKIQQTA